jgi:DNA-directed RNA polymerase specialized sigma subunit
MIEYLQNEKWKHLLFRNSDKLQKNYAVSNMGRVASYADNIKRDGNIIKGSQTEGYSILRLRVKSEYVAFLIHRAIADLFVKKPSNKHEFVIHLNHKKKDNKANNLRWATQEEVSAHNQSNPAVKAAKRKQKERAIELKHGLKLNLREVVKIKQLLANPNRKLTYKQIAEKYGVSEMAITRMKRGENWGHVKV